MSEKEARFSFIVSKTPHIQAVDHIIRRMWVALLAFVPAGLAGIYIFGLKAFYVILISVLSALFSEAVFQRFQGKKAALLDRGAIITGLLFAYNLPASIPLWLAALGSFFATVIAKHLLASLGANIFNPALLARAFLMAFWPKYMTAWMNPRFLPDAISSATPLMLAKEKGMHTISQLGLSYKDLFLGNRGGCIGEVCILAILIGAAILLIKQYINWRIPASYILSFAFFSWVFLGKNLFQGDVMFQILSGGLILGAFFMATDYMTAPITKKGKVIFGLGCGILTFAIRKWGSSPEGAGYAILMMNALTPIINRYPRPNNYGPVKSQAKKIIRFTIIILVICLCVSLVTYKSTKGNISAELNTLDSEVLNRVFPQAISFEGKTLYNNTYYLAKKGNQVLGYVTKVEARGYSSDISMLVGFDKEGNIQGIEVLSQDETPGLGGKITEIKPGEKKPWFLSQFIGRRAQELELKNIQAITQATITSQAVVNAVRESIKEFLTKVK